MSKIEWTDETWNPVTGCTKVSPGCKNCYAERMANRLRGRCGYPEDDPFRVTLHPDRLEQPLRWRTPRRVFVNSMSDLFHPDVPDEFIDLVFAAMAQAPQHTFQVLTKRPERMHLWFDGGEHLRMTRCFRNFADYSKPVGPWPLPNVHLGVSIENQVTADERIPWLLKTPAAVRFVSAEPLLGAVNLGSGLSGYVGPDLPPLERPPDPRLDQVIVGGESGPGARPMHPDWVRSIRDQCLVSKVPFFFKQWGEYSPHVLDGKEEMVRLGKKNGGRLLDGRTWDEMPEV